MDAWLKKKKKKGSGSVKELSSVPDHGLEASSEAIFARFTFSSLS